MFDGEVFEYHHKQFSLLEYALFENDEYLCKMTNERRLQLRDSPSQSFFRVYALLIVEMYPDSKLYLIDGTNSEQGYIGGAICAERSALVKLRFLPPDTKIKKVVIGTDNSIPIAPGLLCREYIMSLADPTVPIVLASNDNTIITRCTIGSLYPYPYIYRYQRRDSLTEFAENFSKSISPLSSCNLKPEIANLFERTNECLQHDKFSQLHPLKFAASVLFDDGQIEYAWQLKGLEYGCTIDPVTQLIHAMEKRKFCQVCSVENVSHGNPNGDSRMVIRNNVNDNNSVFASAPVLLLFLDQYGIAHAPFGQARALLTEHGYGNITVIVHDASTLLVTLVNVSELTPEPPVGARMLCSEDFIL